MPAPALRYAPDLEQPQPDEADTQQQLMETFHKIIDTTNKDFGHAYRGVHAKSHALLEGELTVAEGLPAELAQGAFAQGGKRYPALIRISTNPGDPLPDAISVPRGFALKIIGVEGERLAGSEGDATQDFVLAVGPVFVAPEPKAFLANLKMLAATTDQVEGVKKAMSAVLRGTEKALETIGLESPRIKSLGGYPQTHPLGERFFSQAPLRWGDHVAKVAIVPLSANFKALEKQEVDVAGRDDALREEVASVLAEQGGTWELRAQLMRDKEKNPIEDASVLWPEEDNPYVTVATISVPAQPSWTWERAKVVDDETSFSPWHGLAAHRPLGGIMRARRPAYQDAAGYRARLNGCPIHEPTGAPALAR